MGRRASGPAYLSRHDLDRTIAVALTIVVFAASWYRHTTFRSSTYDLAVFEQVVWKMAHGHGATSSLTSWNAFADHLSPILVFFVPLFRLLASPVWFFAAQAIAVGFGALCIRPLAGAVGLDAEGAPATFLVAVYGLHPAMWNAALYDFHPTTLAIPFLLLGCHAALRQRHAYLWLTLLALIILRDDLGLAAAAVAVVGWRADTFKGRRQRALVIAAGFGWTVLGAQVGAAMGATRHFTARYGYLGDSMTDAATHPLHAVTGLVRHVVSGDNVYFAFAMLLPFAFVALRRPAWLALGLFVALPALAATDPNLHSPQFHYGATVLPFLVLASAGALAALGDDWKTRAVTVGPPLAAVAFTLIGPIGTATLSAPAVPAADVRAALATIRPTDVVVSTNVLGPHLAHRDQLIPFPYPFTDTKVPFPLDPSVTSTATSRQEEVDVIVVSNRRGSRALIERVEATAEVRENFERTDFGNVTVFHRK